MTDRQFRAYAYAALTIILVTAFALSPDGSWLRNICIGLGFIVLIVLLMNEVD